jgi:hypothetical protein
MRLIVLLMSFTVMAKPALADALVWKTELELESSKELPAACNPETDGQCGDSVAYLNRSKYGTNVYFTFQEAVRVTVAFGTKPNDGPMFLADQLHPGAYDWVERKLEARSSLLW